MTSYPRRIRVLFVFAAFLLTTCASPSPPAKQVEPPSVFAESTPASARSDHAHAIAEPPSLKPSPSRQLMRSLTGIAQATVFPATLSLCPRMTVSNAPKADNHRQIHKYRPFVDVDGKQIAVAPVEEGCLSSGFGVRNGRPHKGIDLYHAEPVKVFAAANGTVREKLYRKDYGNMLVIEHGDRLFARYAHLEQFAQDIQVGAKVSVGQTIGFMGNTASYRIPRHLHYEVLTGDYGAAAGSFHLTPVDLFAKLP